jgi:D-alanyl-D-alanine-carboxypeptidase/D-alanyl-D-alanine-endopeptidase
MQRILLTLLLSLNCFLLSAQTIKRIDGSSYSSDSLNNKIDYLMKKANVSGLAISVFNDNKPVYMRTHGYANVPERIAFTDSSVMYAASFAKTVFAYITALYVQEGVIDLDKPLQEYLSKPLPDYVIKGWRRGYHDLANDDRYKKITARMCLTHTAGFPNWRWFEPDKKLKFIYDPGTRYNYSGEGLYLLQFVLEQITDKDYESIVQERVCKPFNMPNTSHVWLTKFEKNTCYGHNEKAEIYELMKWKEASASGSMSTTFSDFIRFYTAFINAEGLTKSTFLQTTSAQVRIRSKQQFGPNSRIDVSDNDGIELSYGLGIGVFKTTYGRAFFKEGHDEGWGHYSIAYPDKKIAVVIMTNNDKGESIFKELLAYSIGDVYTPCDWEGW